MLSLHASTVILFLVCYLWHFRFVQCRTTASASEHNNQADLEERCLRWCRLQNEMKIPSGQTCFEKCLRSNKEVAEKMLFRHKRSSTSGTHFLTPLSRRRKRSVSGDQSLCPASLCPANGTGKNAFVSFRSAERKRYENSHTWYVNISWDPINEEPINFTGYAFIYRYIQLAIDNKRKFICRQKNETYVVFNESSSTWMGDDMYFTVMALPCQRGSYGLYENLADYLPIRPPSVSSTSERALTTATVSPTNERALTTATVSPTNERALTTAILSTVTIGSLVVIAAIAYLLLRKYHRPHRKIPLTGAFIYDAFIIFNHKDQEWVDSKLLQLLEVRHDFKCCVHYRDFEVGIPFVENMHKNIQVSRKVIAVVSKNFFTSEFCSFELHQAIYKQVKENDDSILVIRRDDVSIDKLPVPLKERSFIDYSNKVERKTWRTKLIKALESNRNDKSLSSNNTNNRPYPV